MNTTEITFAYLRCPAGSTEEQKLGKALDALLKVKTVHRPRLPPEGRNEAQRLAKQKWAAAHPGAWKDYKESHPERLAASQAAWRARNREKVNRWQREYMARKKI